MTEDYFLRCRVWAWLAWGVMKLLFVAAWVVAFVDRRDPMIAGMLAASGLMVSAIAATLHIRSFMVRVCSLVRAASYRDVGSEGLRPVG